MNKPKQLTKRQQNKLATRYKLLSVAEACFSDKGIEATPTLEITTMAGVAHGTLFVHFPTREDLVSEVIAFSLGRLATDLQAQLDQSAGLKQLLDVFINGLSSKEQLYERVLKETDNLPSVARSTLLSIQSSISNQLYRVYVDQRENCQYKTIRQDLLFITWMGIVNHFILNRDLYISGTSVLQEKKLEMINHFIDLISKGKQA